MLWTTVTAGLNISNQGSSIFPPVAIIATGGNDLLAKNATSDGLKGWTGC
jgi:hypothetical protein